MRGGPLSQKGREGVSVAAACLPCQAAAAVWPLVGSAGWAPHLCAWRSGCRKCCCARGAERASREREEREGRRNSLLRPLPSVQCNGYFF